MEILENKMKDTIVESVIPQNIDVKKIESELKKQKKKERAKEKIYCECGKQIRRSQIAIHRKKQVHLFAMQEVKDLQTEADEIKKQGYSGVLFTSICKQCNKSKVQFKECDLCNYKVCKKCFEASNTCYACKKSKVDDNRVILATSENIDVNKLPEMNNNS